MSNNTLRFTLPESMRDYVREQVRSGSYRNNSEYLRDLIRRDQQEQATRRFRTLVADGLESGPSRPLTDDVVAELSGRASSGGS